MASGSARAAVRPPPGLPAPQPFVFMNGGGPAPGGLRNTFRLMEVPEELEGLFARAAERAVRTRKGGGGGGGPGEESRAHAAGEGSHAPAGDDHLVIRGSPSDEAVVCTTSRTFGVKERQTSNSLLVCARREGEGDGRAGSHLVLDVQSALLECTRRTPRLVTLDELLRRTAYDGPERERELKESSTRFYGADQLGELVQASEEELIEGLRERGAVMIDGFHRVITRSYTREMLDILLTTSTLEGIPLHAFSMRRCLEAVRREAGLVDDERILRHVAAFFSKPRGTGGLHEDDDVITFCEERVGKFLAEEILCRDPNKIWPFDEFLNRWEEALPDAFLADAQMLKGLAIVEPADRLQRMPTSSKPDGMTLRYFPRSSLSPAAAQRFQELFFARPRWPAAEIRPYLEDLEVSPAKVDKLLLKYARRLKDASGNFVYTSRIKGV